MILNRLGKTDIHLSALGFGTWAIGGGGYLFGMGEQDDKEAIAAIYRGLELGINWIDTAPVYGLGHSEELVAKIVKELKNKIYISTKCGFRWDDNKKIFSSLTKKSIREEIDDSLRRLKLDVIDLYMIHKPDPPDEIEEGWSVLVDLVKEGKIRYAGVSTFSLDQLKKVHSIRPVDFIQPEYSMLAPATEDDGILDFCGENKIGIIVFSPMCMGLLTGKFTKEKVQGLPADDWRHNEPYFQEPFLSANLQLIERLRPIATKNKRTMGQLALAWVLRRHEVTAAIVGARRPSQIEETAPAGDWQLSAEDKTEANKILKEYYGALKTLKEHNQV